MLRGFTRVTLMMMGPLLTWLTCFTAVYVLGALACARDFAQLHIAGFGIVGMMTAVLVLAGAAFTLWQIASSVRHVRSTVHNDRFSSFLALSLGGLAVLGLVLLSLPALITRPVCAGQPNLDPVSVANTAFNLLLDQGAAPNTGTEAD